MARRRLLGVVRMAAGLPTFLRHSITTEQACIEVQRRVASREERFLAAAHRLIYANPSSPYRRLLRWAGVEASDLNAEVRSLGLDEALARLRDAGVYLTHREFRGLEPIHRTGLTIEPYSGAFTNPMLVGGVSGRSSGTRSTGTSVDYTWEFLAEEAATERLLFEQHGLTRACLAMWLPALPGIAGLHNLLLHLKAGPAVQAWFSQAAVPDWRTSTVNRAALSFVVRCGGLFGHATSTPVHVPVGDAGQVAAWMAHHGAKSREPVVLKTYASSAVRVVAAATELGLDLRQNVVFTGGEPLTARRRRFLECAGLAVHPRYATTESGMVGGACGRALDNAPDAVHVYVDRLAVVKGHAVTHHEGHELCSLAFTSLSLHAPRVLLNAELGDWGVLEQRRCDCRFGAAGMHLFVARITSPEKLTGEGMSLLSTEMDEIVGSLVEQEGGSPEDYQFWESHDDRGIAILTIAVDPALRHLDEQAFARQVLEHLAARRGAPELAATLWRDAGAIRVVRGSPRLTGGHKMVPIVRRPDA